MLLVGPTGCGKTPLGELIGARGLGGRRAVHFDFGEHLRRAAASPADYALLSPGDIEIISTSLSTGALLTDDQFTIAEKLLCSFAGTKGLTSADRVVLNGIPRHVGQALKMARLIQIACVVYLECDDDTVLGRIAVNAGGDRTGRVDDQREAVLKKLAVFKEQTLPLAEYYERRQVSVARLTVTPSSSAEHILAQLNASETTALVDDFLYHSE
jgi:adenylate kinase